MATAHSARVRSTGVGGVGKDATETRSGNLTGAFSAFADRRRSGGGNSSRFGSSPARSPIATGGRGYTGLVVFKSQAARKKRHAKFLSQFRREERMAMSAAARHRGNPQEVRLAATSLLEPTHNSHSYVMLLVSLAVSHQQQFKMVKHRRQTYLVAASK